MNPAKTALEHELTGTVRPGREETYAPEPIAAGRPKYPRDISPEAKSVFKRLVKLLEARRVLTEGDSEILRLYALLFSRHQRALDRLAAEGEIRKYQQLNKAGEIIEVEKQNLWLNIASTCERNMLACLDRLGLTPLARKNVRGIAKEKPVDEFEQLLKRTKQPGSWAMPTYQDEVPKEIPDAATDEKEIPDASIDFN